MNRKRRRSSLIPRVEDVPELLHQIQSRLHVKEAARTSVLSKSWLHAWSTIPTLRFSVLKEQEERKHVMKMKLVDVERTLIRYLRDNIQIESFDLSIDIENQEAASLAEKWIRSVATKTSLKELSLTFRVYSASLHLPEEILSGENLTKLLVSGSTKRNFVTMTTSHINTKCVSLKELRLSGVRISAAVLHHIFSSCCLLEKIELSHCSRDLKTIKVTNLPFLYHLHISTFDGGSTALEINHVPNLRFLICHVHVLSKRPLIKAHSIALGSNVTKLTLGGGVITDNVSLDMFMKSGLPFLENLKLYMECWMVGSLRLTCASLKRLSLFKCPRKLVDVVHVNAPNLRFFSFSGDIILLPSLLFPVSADLERMEIHLSLEISCLNAYFFIKMREALTFSSRNNKYQVRITLKATFKNQPLNIDVNDLRARLPSPPAMNVQRLLVKTVGDECLWERSPFFDAFFEICHPEHVIATPDNTFKNNNHFCKLILKEVLEKSKTTTMAYWGRYLKHVRVLSRSNRHHKWETLTDSHKGFLEEPTTTIPVQFLLKWR